MEKRSVLMWQHHAWESPIRVGGRAFAEQFLEAGWDVAWLNGPLAPWNLLRGNDEVKRRRAVWRSGGEERRHGAGRLFLYSPVALIPYRAYPVLELDWFHRHSLDVTWPPFTRVLRDRSFHRVDLLWMATGSPFMPLMDRVPARYTVYRLSDETSGFPDTPSSYAGLEKEILTRVDLVIATAHRLADRASKLNSNVLLLPNGVDLNRFRAIHSKRISTRTERGRPNRVVYVGAIDAWFDRSRVATLARALPATEFLLVGPVRSPMEELLALPNVTFSGPMDPSQIPGLLATCGVGIIPFVDNSLTQAIHPVKLYEYCAAGLPVVASDLEEIRHIGSPARLARNDEEWIRGVREGLSRTTTDSEIRFADRHDWSSRFSQLMQRVNGTDIPGESLPRQRMTG